jgi:signal transduction histidine kinase
MILLKQEHDIQPPWLIRALHWLDNLTPMNARIGGVLMIALIGILSYATGPQLSCSLFYLIPILLVTRVAGFQSGFLASLLAAVLWLFVDLSAKREFDHPVIPFWNATMRFGTFLVGVTLVSAMRSLNSHLEERVIERTAALQRQFEEKRELEKNILEISDREQVRLGQDLHDGLCQQLVSAAFSTTMLQHSLDNDPSTANRAAEHISEMIDDAINQARNLARGLYPVRLETEGLEMALRELASTITRRFGITCDVVCHEPLPNCKHTIGIHLYRIAQESLINSGRHSKGSRICINLATTANYTKMSIKDNGIGFNRESCIHRGMGLNIMEYRARMIGASFCVNSSPIHGTEITSIVDSSTFAT